MSKSRFWKKGEEGCQQAVTAGYTLVLLKVFNYVPAIEWTFVIPMYVMASLLVIGTGALASHYADIERHNKSQRTA